MASPRNLKWLNLPTVIFLLLLQLIQMEAAFVGKESCDFESSETLDVNSKMWIMSGHNIAEATTSVGQKLYFPPNSVLKVSIRKDNTTVIEAQHPHVMVYRLPNVTQLQIVSGELSVSCINDRKRAEKELGVVDSSTDSSSSEFSTETDPSATLTPGDATSSTANNFKPRSFRFANSFNNSSSREMKNVTSNVGDTTERTSKNEETTKRGIMSGEPVTQDTTNAVVSTTSTTRKPSAETKPIAAATSFVMSETEEETIPHSVITPRPPANIPVPRTQSSEAQTTTVSSPTRESQSSSPIAMEPDSSTAPFKVEDHIPYFAACGVLLFVTVLVAATICIVQRRRSRRRSLDNHEDLFITSTYDEMLIRNTESVDGRSSRVMMYGDEPVTLDPHELESRILGGITDIPENDDEKPRCLADH